MELLDWAGALLVALDRVEPRLLPKDDLLRGILFIVLVRSF